MAAASGKTQAELTIVVLRYLDLTLKRARPSFIEHATTCIFNDTIRDQFHLCIFGHAGPRYQTANGGDFMIEDVVRQPVRLTNRDEPGGAEMCQCYRHRQ